MASIDLLQPQLRPATPKPLYAQVRDMLLARIRRGEWGAGESLPNEHVLSRDFDVSIGTVRRAVAELEVNGVLVRKQGRGTYVAGQGAGALAERFCALRAHDDTRLAYRLELVGLRHRTAEPVVARRLDLGAKPGVIEIVQRLIVAGMTVGLETSVLPAALLPRLETQLRFGQPLYPVLADYGHLVTRVEDVVAVEPADAATAGDLGVAIDSPLIVVARLAATLEGRPVEWRVGRYLPSAVRYAAVHGGASAMA